MTWAALIVSGAALVLLAAVAASGMGPVGSLRRAVSRLSELNRELDGLRRSLDRIRSRSKRELH